MVYSIVQIIYSNDRSPEEAQPYIVMVNVTKYTSPHLLTVIHNLF